MTYRMKKDLNQIIDNFKKLRILVIGDAILDTYEYGTIEKICREAPVPVFNLTGQKYCCGGAANTALNLSALGAETFYLTVLGQDSHAREIIKILQKNNVHTDYIIKEKTRKTIAKKRVTASSNIILRIDEGTIKDIGKTLEKELLKKFLALYKQVDAVLFSDYNLGVITDGFIKAMDIFTLDSRKPFIVDSKNLARFKDINPTVVKPNYPETLQLLKLPKVAKDQRVEQISKNVKAIFEKTGAENVAVTLDIDGVVLLQPGKKPYRIICDPQDSKKTIGAGDTFVSALTLGVASKLKMEIAAEIAAAAAAIVVQKEGTEGCTNQQLKSHFNAIPKYISNGEDLLNTVAELKKKGKKIVFTNGCFDLIHKGHIALLKKAREAGDVLIVGVNSDESVRKVKGHDRPINTLEDRIEVLAGLQSIDYLVSFSEESPVELIKAVHPDIFVKGDHYTETSIPEAPLLKKLGCAVKIIPSIEDISTTELINKINVISEETEQRNEIKIPENILSEDKIFS
jgi:D-beta-D-heptose 7-phosphate kinase / D-beta-D-heptose 1-phosphate adenosyltransferase